MNGRLDFHADHTSILYGGYFIYVYCQKIKKNAVFEVKSTGSVRGSWSSVGGSLISLRRWAKRLKVLILSCSLILILILPHL